MIYTAITVIIIIASLLLIGIVLIQKSKGGGLSSGLSAQNQIMGVQKTTDFVENATWILVSIVVFFSVISVAFLGEGDNNAQRSSLQDYEEVVTPNNGDAPDFGGDAK